jgi:hypothetical protein
MDQLVDMLILTGFLSAVFCILGVIAGLCEWVEQNLRDLVIPLRQKPPLPAGIRKLPVVKNAGSRKSSNTVKKAPRGRENVARFTPDFRFHCKAA